MCLRLSFFKKEKRVSTDARPGGIYEGTIGKMAEFLVGLAGLDVRT